MQVFVAGGSGVLRGRLIPQLWARGRVDEGVDDECGPGGPAQGSRCRRRRHGRAERAVGR